MRYRVARTAEVAIIIVLFRWLASWPLMEIVRMVNFPQIPFQEIDSSNGGVLVELIIVFFCLAGMAIVCDRYLSVSLETCALRWKMRDDVAGATILALGSSLPEILIFVCTLVKGHDAETMGVSSVIGSGLITFLVLPALCTLVCPSDSVLLKRRPIALDVVTYSLSLLTLYLFFDVNGFFSWKALVLVALYVVFLIVVYFSPKVRYHIRLNRLGRLTQPSTETSLENDCDETMARSLMDSGYDSDGESSPDYEGPHFLVKAILCTTAPLRFLVQLTCPSCGTGERWESLYPITFLTSFSWTLIFSDVLVDVFLRWITLIGGSRKSPYYVFFGFSIVAVRYDSH